ncbi:MAG: amino acid adenylation domain-containing protein [Burkholderiales bacterium]
MTSLAALLDQLNALDVRLTLDGDRLNVNAPKGTLSAELRAELGLRKDELKAHLRAHPQAGATLKAVAPELSRVPRQDLMPVSHTQQRLWFMKQMDPQSSVYNVPGAFRMRGELDITALEQTLAALVARHESLRTHFISEDGLPRCVVRAEVAMPLERIDLSRLPAAERDAEAVRQVSAIAARPFDLARSPLMHVGLLKLAVDEHVFVFVVDHIISDGVSLGILMGELQALYTEHVTGKPAELPPLPVQYLDYAEWQRRWLAAGALDRQLGYWKERLAGAPPALALPTDRPRPRLQTFNGARTVVTYPAALTARLKALCRAEGVTLYMALLAAFQTLLHRHTGEDDIVVGSVVANRDQADVKRVIGFFANNIVLRGDLSGDPTVRALLARVRDMALKAYEHQEIPFDELVEALAPRRALDHSPVFQVLFVLQSLMISRFDLPRVVCEAFETPIRTARFDMAMDLFDLPDGLCVYLEYNTDLFDASTIDRLLGHYHRLLEGMAADPLAHVDALPMLAEPEQALLLGWQRGPTLAAAEVDTVHGSFEAQAARTPDAEALCFEDQHLSYAELNTRANQLARHLQSLGVRPESLVGVLVDRSVEMVVAILGVLKAGGAYVPLDPAFPRERIDYMVADAALEVVVTHSHHAATLARDGLHSVAIDNDWPRIAALSGDNLPASAAATNLAYVIYTSGSTGKPKGVQIEHASVMNFLRSMQHEPGIGARDRFVSVTTLSFDIAGLELHGPLTCGGCVVLVSRATALDGALLARLLKESRATILQATPGTWRVLLESGWTGTPGLKMLCGGEALPQELADRLLALDGELWNMYGPTETTIWSTVSRLQDTARTITIGRPIAQTTVCVIEPSGLPAPIGVAGELCIGGAGVARGYRNLPELTAEKFVMLGVAGGAPERFYRTGDMARFRADGQLEFIGRRDQQVKLRGFRIELGEIETALAADPGVQQCVAAVREDSPGDQRLIAYVVVASGERFDADRARATLRALLPEYMIPNLFMRLDALPLTPNGKIDRKALPDPRQAADSGALARPIAEPRGPIEVQLMALWRQVLGDDSLGLHDDFFDHGGHSLMAVQLLSRIERVFGRKLPLATLFQVPTVAGMARLLSQAHWTPSWRSLVAINPAGSSLPMFFVPGVGGNVLMFGILSKLLGTDQPVYGLQARGLDGSEEPFSSLPEMAAHYVGEIRAAYPQGPYVVCGTCTGGVVAFEMAQQLVAQGEQVRLAILESWHPSSTRASRAPLAALWPILFIWSKLANYSRALARLPLRKWPGFLRDKARTARALRETGLTETLAGSNYYSDKVVHATMRAIVSYEPRPYPGRLLNLIASKRPLPALAVDTRHCWENLAASSTSDAIQATDSGQLFVSPHVEKLAELLAHYVREGSGAVRPQRPDPQNFNPPVSSSSRPEHKIS